MSRQELGVPLSGISSMRNNKASEVLKCYCSFVSDLWHWKECHVHVCVCTVCWFCSQCQVLSWHNYSSADQMLISGQPKKCSQFWHSIRCAHFSLLCDTIQYCRQSAFMLRLLSSSCTTYNSSPLHPFRSSRVYMSAWKAWGDMRQIPQI